MGRKKHQRPTVRPLNTASILGYMSTEIGPDGSEYKIRHIAMGKKNYICPGCNSQIRIGESHEVVWTEDTILGSQYGIDARRHWHTACWRYHR